MRSLAPGLSLLLCLGGAVAILWGGLQLGRREETLRKSSDRQPLKAFAETLHRECDRLEQLYESHLRRIAESVPAGDDFEIRELCENVAAIRQFSAIHVAAKSRNDYHLPILPSGNEDGIRPVPYIQGANPIPTGLTVPLSAQEVFADPVTTSNWIDVPGRPLMFWVRQSEERAAVFHIDAPKLMATIENWIVASIEAPFGANSQDAWRPPQGPWVGRNVGSETSPDFLLPVQTRFGTWELASWDTVEVTTVYDTPMIAGASTLAALLGLCGLLAFVCQRRSIRDAEQRVSFVNRVSHELRTPLTNIQLNADLAADALNGSAPEPKRRMALVRDESQRLGRLIENVLTFSRSERNALEMQLRPVVPDTVITELLEQFDSSLERRRIQVVREGSAEHEVALDADAFAQILANLVSNVEKYAADGKLLRVRVRQDSTSLSVTIADSGQGIASRDRKRIFKPFKRLSTRTADGVSGTGLGLTIARELAQHMGGTLDLKPSNSGATFVLELPTGNSMQGK